MSSNWRLLAISSAAKNRKKASFNLKKGENRIGNRKGSYIRINSLLCSRSHCTLFLEDDQILLEDYVSNRTNCLFKKRDLICLFLFVVTQWNLCQPRK